jgi:hypothetical protein
VEEAVCGHVVVEKVTRSTIETGGSLCIERVILSDVTATECEGLNLDLSVRKMNHNLKKRWYRVEHQPMVVVTLSVRSCLSLLLLLLLLLHCHSSYE